MKYCSLTIILLFVRRNHLLCHKRGWVRLHRDPNQLKKHNKWEIELPGPLYRLHFLKEKKIIICPNKKFLYLSEKLISWNEKICYMQLFLQSTSSFMCLTAFWIHPEIPLYPILLCVSKTLSEKISYILPKEKNRLLSNKNKHWKIFI